MEVIFLKNFIAEDRDFAEFKDVLFSNKHLQVDSLCKIVKKHIQVIELVDIATVFQVF